MRREVSITDTPRKVREIWHALDSHEPKAAR